MVDTFTASAQNTARDSSRRQNLEKALALLSSQLEETFKIFDSSKDSYSKNIPTLRWVNNLLLLIDNFYLSLQAIRKQIQRLGSDSEVSILYDSFVDLNECATAFLKQLTSDFAIQIKFNSNDNEDDNELERDAYLDNYEVAKWPLSIYRFIGEDNFKTIAFLINFLRKQIQELGNYMFQSELTFRATRRNSPKKKPKQSLDVTNIRANFDPKDQIVGISTNKIYTYFLESLQLLRELDTSIHPQDIVNIHNRIIEILSMSGYVRIVSLIKYLRHYQGDINSAITTDLVSLLDKLETESLELKVQNPES